MFPHGKVRKYTWTAPGVKTHNQTGLILIHRKCCSIIFYVRSFRGADCDADHCLVVEEVRERLAVSKQAAQKFDGEGFNLRKQSRLEVRTHYQINF